MDRAWRLGIASGGLITLSAIIGYYIFPLASLGRTPIWYEIILIGPGIFENVPVSLHVWVLLIPSVLVTTGATLLNRYRGNHASSDYYKILGGIILTPTVFAVIVFFLSVAVFTGFLLHEILTTSSPNLPTTIGPESILVIFAGIAGLFVVTLFLLFLVLFIGGVWLILFVLPAVILTVGPGAVIGYLLARIVLIVLPRDTGGVQE